MGRRINVFCLTVTVTVTIVTTVLIGVTVLSDYWERIHYSKELVDSVLNGSDSSEDLVSEGLFNGRVIVIKNISEESDNNNDGDNNNNNGTLVEILVQLHGGLWTMCLDLTDEELGQLDEMYPNSTSEKCLSQMTEQKIFLENSPNKANSRQIRMQNLSISCSLVCLIILVACLVLLWIGLIERQVPPVLVVSVLYILAAVFGIFSLEIARSRRIHRHLLECDPIVDDRVPVRFHQSRTFDFAWSFHLGWVGVGFCFFSAFCVYLLSKLMRNGLFLV